MTIVLSEGAISLMTTDELVKQSFASVKVGALEIRPGSTRHVRCLAACRSEQSARAAHSTACYIITGNGKDYRQRVMCAFPTLTHHLFVRRKSLQSLFLLPADPSLQVESANPPVQR